MTADGAMVTLDFETTKRAYRVIDKDGNKQEAEFPAMTETAWLEILRNVVEANTTDTQVYDEDAFHYDETDKVDVLVFKAKTEDFVVKVVIDGNEQISNYDGLTYAQFLDVLIAIKDANKALVAGEEVQDGNIVTLNYTSPVERKDEWVVDDFAGSKDKDAKTIVSEDTVVDEKVEGEKLPETGSTSVLGQVALGVSALLGSLGLVVFKKKR